jgi:hypothetical protein
MEHQAADHNIELVIRERNFLNQTDLIMDIQLLLGCILFCFLYHFRSSVNAADLAFGPGTYLGSHRQIACSAANIKDDMTSRYSRQINGPFPELTLPTQKEKSVHNVIPRWPTNQDTSRCGRRHLMLLPSHFIEFQYYEDRHNRFWMDTFYGK